MARDWIAALRQQWEVAMQMANEVPKALSYSDLTLDQASRLDRTVEKSAQDFDRIVEEKQEYDLDDSLFEIAEAIDVIWSGLLVTTANKVMQGLAPIEMVRMEDDDED